MTVAVVAQHGEALSETFVRSHLRNLPVETCLLFGGVPPAPPRFTGERESLVSSQPFSWRVRHALDRRVSRETWPETEAAAFGAWLRRARPDAVLAEFGPVGVSVARQCHDLAIPLVVHFHGYDAYNLEVVKAFQDQYAEMFGIAAGIVVVSKRMASRLSELGADPADITVIPCGADTGVFHGASPAEAGLDVLCVGRFSDTKCPHLLLLIFSRVLRRVPDARLTMVGDGPLLQSSMQFAAALGISRHVSFTGPLPHAQVAEKMRQARVYAQHFAGTATVLSEGSPVSIMEAGAAGLPVVSTRHGGVVDIVEEGRTGILVDEFDVEGMSQAVETLLRDPGLAATMGGAAADRVSERFSLECSIGALWEVIESAIRGSTGR